MEEIQQLQRRINEQVLERAEADPHWRRQLLEDPDTATGDIPETRRLGEMLEALEVSTVPPTAGEEHRQLQRSLMEKMLDRAASDPTWKQQLLDDPKAAMQEANFPEAQQLEELRQTGGAAEIEGHGLLPDYSADIAESISSGCYNHCYHQWGGTYFST